MQSLEIKSLLYFSLHFLFAEREVFNKSANKKKKNKKNKILFYNYNKAFYLVL